MQLALRNDLAELERLATAVEAFCGAQAVPPDAAFHLNLVLEELVTNIVRHGYDEDDATHEIAVRLVREPAAVAVEVVDDGRAFDPLSLPAPDIEASVEERPVGGLGVHLLRSLMRDVHYHRNGGRNHLSFRKLL